MQLLNKINKQLKTAKIIKIDFPRGKILDEKGF
jgi:hypothetical protein